MWKLSTLLVAYLAFEANCYTPIVLWHGMGDTCCSGGLLSFSEMLQKHQPSVHVHSIQVGNSSTSDFLSGYFTHPNKQIDFVCKSLQANPILKDGYNAIGFSQGSQFLRGLAQRCPEPRMKNLVSLGGQHQGVYGIPLCTMKICTILAELVTPLLYNKYIQSALVQATYWQDAKNPEVYYKKNTFLADINNENQINTEYIENLQSLENIIFVQFENDKMVIPKESQSFGFYKPSQTKEVVPVQKLRVYERLGLRKMNDEGKLHFLSLPGEHLEIPTTWFLENVVDKFFK